MPRNPEEIIRELIGSQALTLARLQAQLETAQARIKELEAVVAADKPVHLVDRKAKP